MTSDVVIPSRGCSPYQFGAALAAWDHQLLIGAPYRYYAGRAGEGIPPPTVALFTKTTHGWSLAERLTASDPFAAEGFGRSLALGNAFAAVGAPGYENGDGPVHQFERNGASPFRLRATCDPPGDPSGDLIEYGAALACDSRALFVGAPIQSGPEVGESCGAVYIFDRSANRSPAVLDGRKAREGFGSAIAISNDRMVVGAAGTYSNEQLPGAAYVFARDASGEWRDLCRIDGCDPGEEFGAAVAIDAGIVAVAAPGRSDLDRPIGGRVDLFRLSEHGCERFATIQEHPGFGRGLALLGDRLAIGHPQHDGPQNVPQTGRVGLFRVDRTGTVTREGWLAREDAGEFARLGSAVALGPDYVAAGAPGLGEDDDGSGFVIVRNF